MKDHLTLATLGPEPEETDVPDARGQRGIGKRFGKRFGKGSANPRKRSIRSDSPFNTMWSPSFAAERVTGRVVPECPEWMQKPSKPPRGKR
jgi:hypothetical protein